MNWIKIEDREPKEGQLVLVKGTFLDPQGKYSSIGFVKLNDSGNLEEQHCVVDSHYMYPTYYNNVTEWCEVE